MSFGIIIIAIAIIVVSITIYIIKNQEEFKKKLEISKKSRILRILFYILILLICIVIIIYIYNLIREINKNINWYKVSRQNSRIFEKFEEEIKNETNFYKESMKKDYGKIQKEPYIPDGFEYIEGNVNSGYVIQDTSGNQYVWVPCTNKEDENIVKLEKKDFYENTSIKHYNCTDIKYKEFIESALKYGGFYISRFELGKENDKIVSKKDVEVFSNISIDNAIEKINNMYNEKEINCELINGYAYDTTLSWINKTNNIEIYKIDIRDERNIVTGRNKYNNIYDFTDNIMEITLEEFYNTVVYRGFSNDEINLESRYNIDGEEDFLNKFNQDSINILSVRTVIYK